VDKSILDVIYIYLRDEIKEKLRRKKEIKEWTTCDTCKLCSFCNIPVNVLLLDWKQLEVYL